VFKPKLFTVLQSGYSRQAFGRDIFAGITVGVVAIPLAMAFAIASGLPPERGLFTAIVAGFLISLLGGSRVQIGGPTGAFVVIVSGIVAQYGYSGLVSAMLIAGVFLILMGMGRMGGLIRYIPFPVTTGFTSGIAVVIFSTQIKDLLGLHVNSVPTEFLPKWIAYFQCLETFSPASAAVGFGTIAVVVAARRLIPRWPSLLLGMLAATVAVTLLGLDVETIGSRFGSLPRTLPIPVLPSMSFAALKELIPPAFTIAILCAIESLLSATVADGMTGGRHRSDVELVAQGVANIGSALFGGIPATGAIARTATNIKSGGQSPVAGIVHALTLALVLLFLAPAARLIPLPALAGILVVVSIGMCEAGHFIRLLKSPRSDVLVLLTTFLLTVFVDLTVAVEFGLVLASLLFIRRMAEVADVSVITRDLDLDGYADDEELVWFSKQNSLPAGIEVFDVQGPFFFGAADKFKEALRSLDMPVCVIILRLRNVPAIDATGLYALREFLYKCRKTSVHLVISGILSQPENALKRSGLWDEIGEENILKNIDLALSRASEIVG
jgi:SulP family sulfate permease